MFNFVFILIYIFIIFFISIIYKRFNPNNKEVLRKIIHIGIGPLIPLAKFLDIDQTSALCFTGLVTLLTFINYQSKLFPTIEDVDRKSYGTLFYCLSLFILIYLYWEKDPTSLIAGFFIMTFGDGFAALIGKNFKSKSWIFLNQKKSLFGTTTMFITSLIVVFGLIQNGIYLGLIFLALTKIDANVSVIIASIIPLTVAFFSWIIFHF